MADQFDIYDQAIDQLDSAPEAAVDAAPVAEPEAATPPAMDPYDKAIYLLEANQEYETKQSILDNGKRDIDPVRQAEALRISKEQGIPVDAVYDDIERFRPKPTPDVDKIVSDAPAAGRMLADPAKGPALFPDYEKLTEAEKTIKVLNDLKAYSQKNAEPARGWGMLSPEEGKAEQERMLRVLAEERKVLTDAAAQANMIADNERAWREQNDPNYLYGGQNYNENMDLTKSSARMPIEANERATELYTKIVPTMTRLRDQVQRTVQSLGTFVPSAGAGAIDTANAILTLLSSDEQAPPPATGGAPSPVDVVRNPFFNETSKFSSVGSYGQATAESSPTPPIAPEQFDKIRNVFAEMEQWVIDNVPTDRARDEDFVSKLNSGIMSAGTFLAAGWAARALGFSSTASSAILGSLSGAREGSKDAAANNATPDQQAWRTIIGGLAGVSEIIPVEKYLGWAEQAGGPFWQRLLAKAFEGIAVEGGQELGQGLPGDIYAQLTYDPERNIFANAWENFSVGGTVGAIFGAISAAGDSVVSRRKEALDRYADIAASTNTAQVNSELLEEHLAEMKKTGVLPETVTAPVEAVEALFQTADPAVVAANFPEITRAIEEARASGSEVSIPAEKIAKLAQLEGFKTFTENVRTDPDAPTVAEQKKLQEDIDRVLSEMDTETPAAVGRQSPVFTTIQDQLVKAGQSAEVAAPIAKLYEAFFTTQAQRAGVQPEDLLRRYGLEISSSEITAEQLGPQLDALRAGATPETAALQGQLAAAGITPQALGTMSNEQVAQALSERTLAQASTVPDYQAISGVDYNALLDEVSIPATGENLGGLPADIKQQTLALNDGTRVRVSSRGLRKMERYVPQTADVRKAVLAKIGDVAAASKVFAEAPDSEGDAKKSWRYAASLIDVGGKKYITRLTLQEAVGDAGQKIYDLHGFEVEPAGVQTGASVEDEANPFPPAGSIPVATAVPASTLSGSTQGPRAFNLQQTLDYFKSHPQILFQSDAPTVEGQSTATGNKHGFMPHLRVETGVEIPKGKKPLFAQVTMNSTAPRQIAAIDEILGRHPNATASVENWNAMMADALASPDVPLPPYNFIKNLNGDGSQKLLAKLSPGQIADADHGFANAAMFRQSYINGRISIESTGKLFLWSFLSRGVSPYTQESLFIDSFDGIGQWIKAAADGTLKDRLGEYEAWAKSAAPQGSGQPGAGATHNLNAFGKLFLLKMSEDAGDGTGRSRLRVLHDMMSDPNSTGRAIRRKFLEMGEGVGIDNKVVSFTLLVAGFDDLMVLDRVQIRELWNDGRFDGINLYDGYKVDGKPVAGSALSNLTYGARGLLIYEAIEQGLKAKIKDLYTALGRPDAASVGRYHWETWVASSNQEASHATIDAILAGAKGDAQPLAGVTAKEGEYGAYAYGARYGRDAVGVPYFLYSVPGTGDFKFSVQSFRDFLGEIQVRGNGVIPSKFKVTESGNGPWYNRPEVNLAKLGELAARLGERYEAGRLSDVDAADGKDPPVSNRLAADQPGAPNQDGQEVNGGPQAGPSSSLADVEALAAELGVTISVSESKGVITVSKIVADKRGQGNGTKTMEALVRYADATGQRVALSPSADFGGSKSRLVNFYKRFGFTENKGRSKDLSVSQTMIREPSSTTLYQGGAAPANARGFITFNNARDKFRITLTGQANLSTFLHESGHFFLEVMQDLVERGAATDQQRQDLEALRQWMGLKPGGKLGVPQHEKFARGFEAYLMEGKAPSTELAGIFQKFKSWLVFVYRSLAGLNVKLTDEVRGVMDRLLASDQAIQEARAQVGWRGQPMSQEATGLTDAEYKAYTEAWIKANDAQSQDADARVMLEAARELKKVWRDEKIAMTKAAEAELAKTRGYRAWKLLESGEGLEDVRPGWSDIKIDPASIPSEWRRDATGMTAAAFEGGLPLDDVAEILGFRSGEEMLSVIAGARAAQKAIPAKVRGQMEAKHGKMDANALALEASKAVHNKPTMDVLLTEFRAMATKARQNTPKNISRILAAQAEEKVAQLTQRQLEPAKWRRAELKAATEAGAAAARGDANAAFLAKRRQMVAAHMHKATLDAQDRIEKFRDYLATFQTDRRRAQLGKAGDLYLDGVDQILEAIELKDVSLKVLKKRPLLQEIVERAIAEDEPINIPPEVLGLGKKNYSQLTLGELEAVHDAVKNLWTLAKLKNELKTRQGKIAMDKAMDQIEQTAKDYLGTARQPDNLNPTAIDKAINLLRWGRANLVKMEFLFGWLDGKPDGGLAHQLIYQPIADARSAEYKLMKDLTHRILNPIRGMPREQRLRWDTKRQFMGQTMKGANIIAVALNLGNEQNKAKLLQGYNWNEQQLMAELNQYMTRADWDMVQRIWDAIESLWPHIERVSKNATGLAPPRVVPASVQTPFGEYSGGYYPIVYDPFRTQRMAEKQEADASKHLFTNNFLRPTLANGFTKKRTGYVAPIYLSLDVLSQHLAETVHYVTHYEAVKQADKIRSHPKFQALVTETMGREFWNEIRPWLQDIANNVTQRRYRDFGESFWRRLRIGTSVASMGFNIGTGIQQLFGITTSLDAIGPRYWATGVRKAWLSPKARSNWRFALKESQELEPLIRDWDREVSQLNETYTTSLGKNAVASVAQAAFWHIGRLQLVVNVATWHGAYEQAIAGGRAHADAVIHADSVVRKTQSANAIKDLADVQRSGEGTKLLTMFYSYFSVLYNRLEDIAKETKSVKDVPRAAMRVALLSVVPAMLNIAYKSGYAALTAGDDEEEDEEAPGLTTRIGLESMNQLIGTVPILRNLISFGEFGGTNVPAFNKIEQMGRTATALKDWTLEGETPTRNEIRTTVNVISTLTQTPIYPIYKQLDDLFGEKISDALE